MRQFNPRHVDGASACATSIDFDTAQTILASHIRPIGTEIVSLDKAGRRCLAEPVRARIDGPRCDTAAMDGFAIRTADLLDGCSHFRVVGSSFPANPRAYPVGPGEAVRVTTGAPMPAGADRVVMTELTVMDDTSIRLTGELPCQLHVRLRASDFAAGETIVPAGRLIVPRTLVAAAAADVGSLTVWRRPHVAVLASGDELAEPGSASTSPHGLPDSLSEAILLLCHQWGAKPLEAKRAKDEEAAIGLAAARLLEDCDVLVMIGGAARGERDFAKAGLRPLGLEVAFADVAIKPGKPVWYGRVGSRHIIGLPGNPTAAMTVARLFLVPLLTGLGGRGTNAGLRWLHLPLSQAVSGAGARESFLCAEADGEGARVLDRQSASSQAMLAGADLLVRRPRSAPPVLPGEVVPALWF